MYGSRRLGVIGQRGAGLGHLHEAEHAFIHARAAAGGDDDRAAASFSVARSISRVSFSPTTEPIEPPRKLKSITPSAARCSPILQIPVITASFRPVRFLVILQLGGVGGHPGEAEHVHARHVGIHLLEGAGFDQRMDALAGADGEMMLAMRADLQVLVQFLVENHRGALRALGPQALGNVAFLGFAAGQLGLFGERRGCRSRAAA